MKISEVPADMAPGRKLAGQNLRNKGVRAEHKNRLRIAAEARAELYRSDIRRIMTDHNVSEGEAKRIRAGRRLVEIAKAEMKSGA